ncbi:MAG: response regulator [Chitinophagales bacterium]
MDIRVTLFDDNERLRDSLSMTFSKTRGYVLAGAFADCSNVEIAIEATKPDVILMDIDMPGMNGIEAVKLIRTTNKDVQVLMMTVFDDDEKIFDAICAGANGYVLKSTSLVTLLEFVKEVHEGGSPMSPAIARKVLTIVQQKNPAKKEEDPYDLSDREKEVLKWLVEGDSYKAIADKLFISYSTVNSHIKNIYKKLHVNSMSEAVSKVLKGK